MVNLKSLSQEALAAFMAEQGEPAFRARQLVHWMYERGAGSIDDITEFSKDLRRKLSACSYIGGLAISERVSEGDGTEKYLLKLEDGLSVECVLIPDNERLTLCVSSQVGCAMGCRFCKTGTMGLIRDLEAFEIVEQLLAISGAVLPRRITNIVFMGMGEPLKNLDQVSEAVRRITGPIGMSPRRITVSTCGVASEIMALSRKAPGVNLAVSLNASTDSVRDSIMPVNRRYPISELISACGSFPLGKGRRLTFEYVMLEGVNDSTGDARRLAGLLKGLSAKVNLIPFNPYEGAEFRAPQEDAVLTFQKYLVDAGIHTFIRKSKGGTVMAACGQLWCRGPVAGKGGKGK